MFQFYEPELRCKKQKKSSEELLISLFYSFSIGLILGLLLFLFGHQFLSLFATDAAVIDAADQDHGVFLLCVLFYGLYDRRIPWDRKDHHPDDHYHHGLLRLPYHMDLHDLCLGPHHPGTVSSVSVFMDHHIDRRNHLLYCQLPETQRPVADFLFFIEKARSSALHDHK